MLIVVLNLAISLVLNICLFFTLQKISFIRLQKRPLNLLSNGFIRPRLRLFTTLLTHTVSQVILTQWMLNELTLNQPIFIYCISLAFVISVIVAPELQLTPTSKLVITKPLFSTTSILHLAKPYQDFDKTTYVELLALVQTLPTYHIKNIQLCSPMFYHSNGTLRDFSTLEKLLAKKNARLITHESKPWQNLLGKISMMIDSAQNKKEKLNNINLNKWHVLTIKMEG